MTDPITDFRYQYRWLSNFHLCEIHYEGLVYPSTEHAYQAAKSMDVAVRMLFANPAMSCREAKRFSRTIALRPDWDHIKIQVMGDVLFDKFTRHADLKALLLATGDAELVESNTWQDRFWGVCSGVGENHLGKLLMTLRSVLRTA